MSRVRPGRKKTFSASNEELLELLFTEADRLKQSVAQEIIRRGDELSPQLQEIAMDRILWMQEIPAWWAPVHATYLLAAIGGKEAVSPLLAALRWSDAYDNEWVVEELPAMIGSLGAFGLEPLFQIVADRSAGWSARSIALDCLAAIAVQHPEYERRLVTWFKELLSDPAEERGVRRTAAAILLDLRIQSAREALLAFAAAEAQERQSDPDDPPALLAADVDRELAVAARAEEYYKHNWLRFYDDEEIAHRQGMWSEGFNPNSLYPPLDEEGMKKLH